MSGYTAPNRLLLPARHSIDTLSDGPIASQNVIGSSLAWPSADLAVYVPVIVPSPVVVRSLWYANGSGTAGNYDIGLYDAAGAAILRKGSTAKTATAGEIVWNCTDTTISSGIYYLALVSSSAVDTFYGMNIATAPNLAAIGVLTQASAIPLPATATLAVDQTLAVYPIIGMFINSIPT